MFCSFKFTKKVFVVMCACFFMGLAAGGFGIHKAVTAVQVDKELRSRGLNCLLLCTTAF